jgi:CARDB
MSRVPVSVVALLLLLVPAFFVAGAAGAPLAPAASSSGVTGSMTGPTIVATGSTNVYHISGWGGPAILPNGTRVGNVTYYVSVAATNATGVSYAPLRGNFTTNTSLRGNLTVSNTTQSVLIDVEVSSIYQGKNDSTNFTYSVTVVRPYIVSATIVNPSSATVSGFAVLVLLDGSPIGTVNVTSLAPGGSARVAYVYPTLGLSPGSHTFSLSLVAEHGLVRFANGQTTYTVTIYIAGAAPDYTVWYVAGIVAFFGAIFIFASRVAARRRGAARR